jgi:RNA polymerase sigma-70 factor (ECF subfamily)
MDLKKEKELVIKAKEGKEEAFSQLYDFYYGKIFGYILKRTANIEETQDITSETFFKAFKNLKKFKWKGISFSSWLYKIAFNETVNYFRKKKTVSLNNANILDPITPEMEILKAEETLSKKKEFLELHKKISHLSEISQQVLILKFFEKKKIREIAEILEKPEGTIKSLIHRAIEKLRELMD